MANTHRESDRFMLRLPDGMRDKLKELAAKNGRSMNAEIIHRLEATITYEDVADVFIEQGFDPEDTAGIILADSGQLMDALVKLAERVDALEKMTLANPEGENFDISPDKLQVKGSQGSIASQATGRASRQVDVSPGNDNPAPVEAPKRTRKVDLDD